MPKAPDSQIPRAHLTHSDHKLMTGQSAKHKILAQRKKEDSVGSSGYRELQQGPQLVREARTVPEQHGGVFPFDFGWQLAGLIACIVLGITMMVFSFQPEWLGSPVAMFLPGIGLLALAIYCGWRTKWLQEASTAPLAVRIGTGTAIICGLIPIWAAIIYIVLVVAVVVLMMWVMFAFLEGALSGK